MIKFTCLSVKSPEPDTNEFDIAFNWLLLLGMYDGFVVVEYIESWPHIILHSYKPKVKIIKMTIYIRQNINLLHL